MLFHKIEGEGKVFVFLHGFLESSTMWEYLDLNQLVGKKVFIDLPGHGKSQISLPESPSIFFMAEKVSELLASFAENEITVVGHSMGGYVGIELAKLNENIQKVVLLNSNFWADSEQKKNDRNRVVEILDSAKEKFIQEAIPNLFSDPNSHQSIINKIVKEAKSYTKEGIKFATLAMRDRPDNCLWLKMNPSKVMVIQGELDKTAPIEMMLEKLPANIDIKIIPNVGHMSHIESNEEVLLILKSIN